MGNDIPWDEVPSLIYGQRSEPLEMAVLLGACRNRWLYRAEGSTDPVSVPLDKIDEVLPGCLVANRLMKSARVEMVRDGNGWIGYFSYRPPFEGTFYGVGYEIHAETADLAEEVATKIKGLPKVEVASDEVPFSFVFKTDQGASFRCRNLKAQPWTDLRSNYSASTVDKLDQLVTYDGKKDGGKVVLVRGAPGTGKTHFLLGLAREWADRAEVTYVTDPENFLGSAAYLFGCMTDMPSGLPVEKSGASVNTKVRKIKVFIMEDVDEFITADSKMLVGQGLGRLLNLVDGMLGVGMRILLILSTNEDVKNLHKALTRPGRCLANIEFTKLSNEEANKWRQDHGLPGRMAQATIAELYAELRAKDGSHVVSSPPKAVGFGGD